MKRRLNLFDQRKSTKKTVSYLLLSRKISFWLFIVLVVVNLGLGGVYIYFQTQNQKYLQTQERLNQYLQANREFSSEIQHFVFKFSTLKTYLEQDAQSYQYFAKLIGLLNQTSTQGMLSSFSIDNSHEATFTINFDSYENALAFIDALESPVFQDAFAGLSLEGFSAVTQNDAPYSLNLKGTFVAIP